MESVITRVVLNDGSAPDWEAVMRDRMTAAETSPRPPVVPLLRHRVRPGTDREDALVSGSIAAVVSGIPSTVHALWRRSDPLEAALAAGSLVLPHEHRRAPLLLAATAVHGGLSIGWASVLATCLPTRATVRWSIVAGLAIAALDLGLVGRRFERIRALAPLPQVADHLAFSMTVGAVVRRRRARRHRAPIP